MAIVFLHGLTTVYTRPVPATGIPHGLIPADRFAHKATDTVHGGVLKTGTPSGSPDT